MNDLIERYVETRLAKAGSWVSGVSDACACDTIFCFEHLTVRAANGRRGAGNLMKA